MLSTNFQEHWQILQWRNQPLPSSRQLVPIVCQQKLVEFAGDLFWLSLVDSWATSRDGMGKLLELPRPKRQLFAAPLRGNSSRQFFMVTVRGNSLWQLFVATLHGDSSRQLFVATLRGNSSRQLFATTLCGNSLWQLFTATLRGNSLCCPKRPKP